MEAQSSDISSTQVPTSPVAPEILLSLATGPMLFGIVAASALGELIESLGIASGELFRGDRLPLLKFPSDSPNTESISRAKSSQ